MNLAPYVVQQPQSFAQQLQVQYFHQNIVTSTNTYNDGVNPPPPCHYGSGTHSNHYNFEN